MIICKNRQEWLAERTKGIGASEAAAILGVSPWKSALELFHEKRGTAPPNAGETFARKLGLALEQPIAELYRGETGRVVVLPEPGTFNLEHHKTKPFMVATLDGNQVYNADEKDEDLRNRVGVVEIKTAAITKAGLWREEPPIDYQVQVQHQLAVTGLPYATIVALIGGVSLRYADLKRDAEFILMLEAACEEFWRRIELNDEPPPDGTEATKDFLKRLYPHAKPSSATLPPEAIEWDSERLKATDDEKAAHARKLQAENMLKLAIGENVQGILPNGTVYTWKEISRKGYTVEPTSYRDFRRKGPKEEQIGKKTGAPKLDVGTVKEQFEAEQKAENAVAEDFEL